MSERRRTRALSWAGGAALALLLAPAVVRRLDARRDGDPVPGPAPDLEHIELTSADGTRLHMTACGSGPDALFFVHGWTCNESVFRFQQEAFRDRYRVYTLELRGHGGSAVPASLDYHPDRLAEDLEAAVDFVNPESFVVAGYSLGGFTAFKWFERFAREREGALKGLAIIDSTGIDLVDGLIFGSLVKRLYPAPLSGLLSVLGRRNRVAGALKDALKDSSMAYMVVRWGAFGRRPRGEHVEHMREMVFGTPAPSVPLAAKACLDYEFRQSLPGVDVPVALLLGERDKLTDVGSNRRTADLLPDCRMRVFDGAGHCAMFENRAEFNEELGAFLEKAFAR